MIEAAFRDHPFVASAGIILLISILGYLERGSAESRGAETLRLFLSAVRQVGGV